MDKVVELLRAEAQLTIAEKDVARQKEILADLTRDGHSSDTAFALLATYEATLQWHRDRVETIQAELAGANA